MQFSVGEVCYFKILYLCIIYILKINFKTYFNKVFVYSLLFPELLNIALMLVTLIYLRLGQSEFLDHSGLSIGYQVSEFQFLSKSLFSLMSTFFLVDSNI